MRERLIICLGIFAVMALSSTVVPVLPLYSDAATVQSTIYAAYFLGACMLTLPAGVLSDRYGRVIILQSGLAITLLSGILLVSLSGPILLAGARLLEGFGAGLFVAASMAYVNSLPDHEKMSGYFLASLNAGLISGLILGGVIASHASGLPAGILVFTGICLFSMVLSLWLSEPVLQNRHPRYGDVFTFLVTEYPAFWYAVLVMIGLTGVLTSIYPEFSGVTPDTVAFWIAGMSVATIVSALVFSRVNLPPVFTIRIAAPVMAAGMILSFFSPAAFLVVGSVAGAVMVAQMAFLAQAGENHGTAMGLYSTTSYLGMSVLPVFAGAIADIIGFFPMFFLSACMASSVALVIGRCSCGMRGIP